MSKVITDTNSLIYAIQKRIDLAKSLFLIDEVTGILVPACVVNELRALEVRNPDAKTALSMLNRFEFIDSEGQGDDCVLRIAIDMDAFILSNDKELISRARRSGLRTLSIRANGTIKFN